MNFQETLFPGYTIGEDAYQNIPAVCAPFGKKAAIIGGKRALAAAEEKIRRAVAGSAVEITGTYWYGGEASVENIAKLQPQVAQAPQAPRGKPAPQVSSRRTALRPFTHTKRSSPRGS